jgi:hypothetical protein
MSEEVVKKQGFVSFVSNKRGNNSAGPWVLGSFKIEDPNGTEDPLFYQLGFKECKFKKGDYVRFDAEPAVDARDGSVVKTAMAVIEGSGAIVKNPPKRTNTKKEGGKKGGWSGGPKVTKSEVFGDIGGYNTEDDIKRISWASARTAALEVVSLLLEYDALPGMVKTSGNSNKAKRFEIVTQAVDKLTVEYFFDSATCRKLQTVADSGKIDAEPDTQLPDPVNEGEAKAQEKDTTSPPPVDDNGSEDFDDDIPF